MSETSGDRSWTTWFEIPVINFHRARVFYENLFQMAMEINDFGTFKMGVFPHKEVGCAICQGSGYRPSEDGVVVYLNANPDLSDVLERVVESGGKIVKEKTMISSEHGHMALIIDTEGNRVALHSDK